MRSYLTKMDRFNVYVRTLHFISLIIDHEKPKQSDLETSKSFLKYLNKNGIHSSAGFNKNKRGYLEAIEAARNILRKEES